MPQHTCTTTDRVQFVFLTLGVLTAILTISILVTLEALLLKILFS